MRLGMVAAGEAWSEVFTLSLDADAAGLRA